MQPQSPALEHRQRPAGDSGCSSSGKQTPSAATVWSKMLRLFLSHLLGLCLLLILCAREIPAQKTALLRVCGREYVRLQIQICGSVRWGKRNQQYHRESRESRQIPSALLEIASSSSSSINDAETSKRMLESIPNLPQELRATLSEKELSFRELQPALESSNLNLAVLGNRILDGQNRVEDQNLSELGSLSLESHYRKKRRDYISYSDKCCHQGCTREELLDLC
ncbi:prorelaxin H1 [Crocuta crocuta]